VEFRMLSDERDLIRLRDGVGRMIEILRHPAVKLITDAASPHHQLVERFDSAEAIDGWLAANVSDYVHAVGTCRMGRPDDSAAVVDPQCAVRGYRALRVCDASVMPDLPKANTHLTTVAVAERFIDTVTA
jgi:5-(hydroxymethyl)furfural/furfural oxidase